ncbi:Delphilin, partial [Rhizoclosmatium hyalinum]
LADVRCTEGKGSLLHFMADIIETKFPELSGFSKELENCTPAARLSIEVLKSDLKVLQKGLKDMLAVVDVLKTRSDNSDDVGTYLELISPFSVTAKETVDGLLQRMEKLETTFKNVVGFFGEDPDKTPFDEFFGMFKLFLQSYEVWTVFFWLLQLTINTAESKAGKFNRKGAPIKT